MALRGMSYLEQAVVVLIAGEVFIGLFVAVVAASDVSTNKIKSPRDVTHPLPGGFPFLLHISVVPLPASPRSGWACCWMRVSGGGDPPATAEAVPLAFLRVLGRACRCSHARARLIHGSCPPFLQSSAPSQSHMLRWSSRWRKVWCFCLRCRRQKRPWDPPAMPWDPSHVPWHAASSSCWCSSTPLLRGWELRGWQACFSQVKFPCQSVVWFICRYGSAKAVAGARVDRQLRLMSVLRFAIGDCRPILLNPVKPPIYLRFKTTILEDTGRSDSRGERRLGYRSARPRTLDASIMATSRRPSGPDGPCAPDGSITHVFRCRSAVSFTCLCYVIWEFVFSAWCIVP